MMRYACREAIAHRACRSLDGAAIEEGMTLRVISPAWFCNGLIVEHGIGEIAVGVEWDFSRKVRKTCLRGVYPMRCCMSVRRRAAQGP